ncbi:MAG TPA: SRPBCC family protein [Solirubrobacterales bacterium]
MPRISRRRTIDAPGDVVWSLVSDPYNLPRWWPRTTRVENVERTAAGKRSQWTKVLETAEGRGVRADYRCLSSAQGKHYVWEQQLGDTPFDRILRSSVLEIELEPADGGTQVRLTSRQVLRGMSRLGSPMMRRATAKSLVEALNGIERALVADPEGEGR